MRTVGIIATGLALSALGAAVVVGVASVPDIRRYLRMRAM